MAFDNPQYHTVKTRLQKGLARSRWSPHATAHASTLDRVKTASVAALRWVVTFVRNNW